MTSAPLVDERTTQLVTFTSRAMSERPTLGAVRSPRDFFRPLAVGAPEPLREIPFRPSRMIHFFPPQNAKVVAKLPDIVPTVDVLLGNLEDAIPASDKEAARAGLVRPPTPSISVRRSCGRGSTASTRRGDSTTS